MADTRRDSGIRVLGRVPWGTHFCQFYQTRRDLLAILVPYFKAGLAANEFCMWICSEPLGVEEAGKALARAVPDLGGRIEAGQIEILAHTDWYLKGGRFGSRRVLRGWVEKLEEARSRGFEGLRLSGNTFWLEKGPWDAFAAYEEAINKVLSRYPMLALCTYSLDRCGAGEIVDVLGNHERALIRRKGRWILVAGSPAEPARHAALAAMEERAGERTSELVRTVGRLRREIAVRREREGRLQQQSALLELARDAILVRDPDYRITFWNDGARKTYGWTPDEALGRIAHDLLETDFPEGQEKVRASLRRGGHWEGELVRKCKDGRRIVVESRWAVLPGPAKRGPRAILEISRDVTERRHIEEALRSASAYTRGLIEASLDPLVTISAEGKITDVNRATETATGVPRARLIGTDFSTYFTEPDRAREGYRRVFEKGEVRDFPLALRHVSGRITEVLYNAAVYRDADDREAGVFAAARDMTREMQLQERVRQWQKMEALGTLAGGIAHDFNNILLPILINTELTLAEEPADSPASRRLGQVLEAAQRGKDMVRQIIAFSQQKEQDRCPVEIVPLVREALKLLRISMPQTIEIVERVPAESPVAVADPTQIQQVLMNLGNNAAFAMRDKGGTLTVDVSEAAVDRDQAERFIDVKPGPYIRLTVSDTGPGIPPDVIERIFEPFFTTKKKGEGTGMGLAVVHGIVKSHGGAIAVSSKPGAGTAFNVYLPRAEGRPVKSEKGREPYPGGHERILFVDDEDIQVRAMTKLLEHLGYSVTGRTGALEALGLFREAPEAFDLVIMDQSMPRMTGGELAAEMLRLRPGLPVIICTGYSETLAEEQALAMGIKAFIMKPFSVAEIARGIRRVLAPGS